MENLKLFMLMLGCKPPGRHTEQHDIFFGISNSLKGLMPQIKAFWPEPERIHIDAWREVNTVDGFRVSIAEKEAPLSGDQVKKLFFINLGGYQENKFEEQHYVVLTAQKDLAAASKNAKSTLFFQHNHFEGATSHIDDKYGIDVDDIYQVEDMLAENLKDNYRIELIPAIGLQPDAFNLGYTKLSNLK